MPKNQRAYPKGKPRMAEVIGDELDVLFARSSDIGVPALTLNNGKYYAKADEMRKWRGFKNTSTGEQ